MQSAVISDKPTENREETSWETRYPNIKPTIPRAELVDCTVCFNPGFKYIHTSYGKRYMYYVHSNEPAIGVRVSETNKDGTQKMRFKYRTCSKDGRLYDSLEQTLESRQKLPKPDTVAKSIIPAMNVSKRKQHKKHRKSIIVKCECGKDGSASIRVNKKYPNTKSFIITHKERNEAGNNIQHCQKTPAVKEAITKLLEPYAIQQQTTQNIIKPQKKRNAIHNKLMLCYCGKEGYPSRFTDKGNTRYNITHDERIPSGDHLRHNIKTLEHKELAIEILGPKKLDIRVLEQLLQRSKFHVPPGKSLELCKCGKEGYKYESKSGAQYNAYFMHYSEGPIGKTKHGFKKYRRCNIQFTSLTPSLVESDIQPITEQNKIVGLLRRHRDETNDMFRRHINETDELIQDLNNK